MNKLPLADIAVIIIYFLSMIAMGVFLGRKNKNAAQFTTASGSIPGWAIGLSIFGTYLSSNTFLGVPGKAFGSNWSAFVFSLSIPIAAVIAAKYFVPFFRRTGEISAYEHLEKRFGPWARVFAVICFLLTQLGRTGTIFLGVGITLHALTGFDIRFIIVVTGLVVTLYTVLGGMEAVIWTEVVQSIIKTLGAMAVLFLVIWNIPGGISEIIQKGSEAGKFSLGSFRMDFTGETFWVILAFGVFVNLTNFGIDQNYVQRYHTAPTEKEAVKSLWISVYLYVPVSLLFFIIGSSLYAYYTSQPQMLMEVKRQVAAGMTGLTSNVQQIEALANNLTEKDVGDKIMPHFIVNKVPSGVVGLIFAAILSAAMGTISSGFNSCATIYLEDIHKRYINPTLSSRQSLKILYAGTLTVGFIATLTGIFMIGAKSILDIWWQLLGIFSGGMLGLFLLGIITKKTKSSHALIAVIAGTLIILWMTFSVYLPPHLSVFRNFLHTQMTIVGGTIMIFLVGLVTSQFSNLKLKLNALKS